MNVVSQCNLTQVQIKPWLMWKFCCLLLSLSEIIGLTFWWHKLCWGIFSSFSTCCVLSYDFFPSWNHCNHSDSQIYQTSCYCLWKNKSKQTKNASSAVIKKPIRIFKLIMKCREKPCIQSGHIENRDKDIQQSPPCLFSGNKNEVTTCRNGWGHPYLSSPGQIIVLSTQSHLYPDSNLCNNMVW